MDGAGLECLFPNHDVDCVCFRVSIFPVRFSPIPILIYDAGYDAWNKKRREGSNRTIIEFRKG